MNISHWLQEALVLLPVVLFSLTIHECAHGWVALQLGDPTARDAGRLTLNPFKHLDLVGTLAFFIIKFGWAKPVPVDWRYFKNPLRDMLWVALAGPVSNLFLAAMFSGILHWRGLLRFMYMNEILHPLIDMLVLGVIINVVLAVFNMIPITPLDGSRVLMGILPREMAMSYSRLEPYGMVILILMMFTGIFGQIIGPVVSFAQVYLIPGVL